MLFLAQASTATLPTSSWINLSDAGSWASLIGFPLTLLGLAISYYQIWQSRKASEAAQKAVEDFRDAVRKTTCLSDLSKALSGIDEVTRLIRSANHSLLPDRLIEVRRVLISVRQTAIDSEDISDDEQKIFQASITALRELEQKITSHSPSSKQPLNLSIIGSDITDRADELYAILAKLKNQIGGTTNDL